MIIFSMLNLIQNPIIAMYAVNKDHDKMNVTRRTCGYLGENFWNVGKTKEIAARVLHI